MNLAEAAAAARAMAERCEASLARDCAEQMARAALAALKSATPVKSGRLRDSETIDSVSGGGSAATAIIAPHAKYAKFRDEGGTISAKDEPARSGRKHLSGKPYRHSLAWPGGFAMHVTQAGSHYMERGEALGRGPAQVAAKAVLEEFIRL